MKIQMQIHKEGEHGLAGLSLFCRFVNAQGGYNAAIIPDMLFSTGSQ